MRDRVWELAEGWSRLGFDLQLAAGLALGHATIGRIGFERRWEYAPVGTVPTLAERLCEAAAPGQILITQRVFAATESLAITNPLGDLPLRGLAPPLAHDLLALHLRVSPLNVPAILGSIARADPPISAYREPKGSDPFR